jgi:hypothetical protein
MGAIYKIMLQRLWKTPMIYKIKFSAIISFRAAQTRMNTTRSHHIPLEPG